MKISTKGRYALRLMMEFARQPEQVTRLKDAAAKQELSEKYLEQIVSVLSKAGFVKSIRGAQGGYLLTRAPESYSVGDILRLTEGNMAPVVCLGQDSVSCDLAERCVSRSVFSRIESAVNEVIDHITLADLLQEEQTLATTAAPVPEDAHRRCQGGH